MSVRGLWRSASGLATPAALSMGALLLVALAVRLALFPQVAYMAPNPLPFSDAAVWEVWSREIWEHGLDDVSRIEPKTYLGYHYVFWAVGLVYSRISPEFELETDTLFYLLKVPPVLFDLALVPLIFVATRRCVRLLPEGLAAARRVRLVQALERRGLAPEDTLGIAAAAAVVLAPGVVYDSAVWAQSESAISFFMLAAVLALVSGRPGAAWALWAVAFVIKPQPVVIVPALAAFTFWQFGRAGVMRATAGALASGFGMLGYFIATGNGAYIIDVYRELFQTYDAHLSINAWNLWWPAQQLADARASDQLVALGPLSLSIEAASFVLLVVATLAILAFLNSRRDLTGLLVACAMLEFAFYVLPISTHERYLYPFFVFLAPVLFLQPRWLLLYAPLSLTFFVNIFFASPTDPDWSKAPLNSALGHAASALHTVFFASALGVLITRTVQTPRLGVAVPLPGQHRIDGPRTPG